MSSKLGKKFFVKVHKIQIKNLCNLPIDKKSLRAQVLGAPKPKEKRRVLPLLFTIQIIIFHVSRISVYSLTNVAIVSQARTLNSYFNRPFTKLCGNVPCAHRLVAFIDYLENLLFHNDYLLFLVIVYHTSIGLSIVFQKKRSQRLQRSSTILLNAPPSFITFGGCVRVQRDCSLRRRL